MTKIISFLIGLVLFTWTCASLSIGGSISFLNSINTDNRIMVVFEDVGNAKDFIDYAENIVKKAIKQKGGRLINPEIMKKVKADKLLWQAIHDGNATAMAQISIDYGARILVRGSLSVYSQSKFGASWEGTASLTVAAIDTTTAEELENAASTPMGTTENPAPIEDSPLIAKQLAVQKVCDEVIAKLGIGTGGGDLKAASTFSFDLYDIFRTDTGAAISARFTSDSMHVAISTEKSAQIIGLHEKNTKAIYFIERGKITSLAGSPDNQYIAIGDSKGYVRCLNNSLSTEIFKVRPHSGVVSTIVFKPDSSAMATGGTDKNIHILSTSKGFELGLLKGHDGNINSLAFTPNGRYLISTSDDMSIRWWDVNVAKQKKAIQETSDKLLCMALSYDGSIVALSTVDIQINLIKRIRKDIRQIKIRNTVTGEEIRVLKGHQKDVTALSFHPSKRFLASGSKDRTVKIWDLQTGEVMSFLNLKEEIIDVDFSKDGRWFCAATRDQNITVWKLR